RKQPRIQAQTRDDGGYCADRVEQLQGGIRPVTYDNEETRGSPAVDLQDHLTRPDSQRLELPPPALGVALGGGEHGKERQRPHASRPREGHQQAGADPAEAPDLHKVAAARTHRIAVDTSCGDPLATPAL